MRDTLRGSTRWTDGFKDSAMMKAVDATTYEVIILGAGYGGLMAALGLAGRSRLTRIALVSERDHFVERIRLQEQVSGRIADRMPPLAAFLAKTKVAFICGQVKSLDALKRCIRIPVLDRAAQSLLEAGE
jgi:NADH:quinone reductase (non-electrogenic)